MVLACRCASTVLLKVLIVCHMTVAIVQANKRADSAGNLSIYLISTRWSSLLGGGLGVGASFGSTLDVLAHISLSRPLASQVGGGDGC